MDIQLIFNIVIFALLCFVVVFLFISKKKSEIYEIIALLENSSRELRESITRQLRSEATEQFQRFDIIQDSMQKALLNSRTEVNEQLRNFSERLDNRLSLIQEQTQKTLHGNRTEANEQLYNFSKQLDSRLQYIQQDNAENIEKINATLENKMKAIQDSNERRLEQMQGIVDEKLQKTLEARLTQSFSLVSTQLDNVQQGLGEMKNLAADAKSLKNALTNVKDRGTYGEVRLEKLLSDILTPAQYETNIEISNNKRVEFAVKLPGSGDTPLLLPIDSKFPIEDYNRLLDAEDKPAIEASRKALANKIRSFAKDIHDKYIMPPKTTDFALMFLPTEGLYAEVIQNVALFEELRDKYKVTAVGCATLSAFLSSLQIGFKTLTIEQRSQEVWHTLCAVKSEFVKFGNLLDKAHKQIQTVDRTFEDIVGKRTRAINKALNNVEALSDSDSNLLLTALESDTDDDV